MKVARYTIPIGIGLCCVGVILALNAKPTDTNTSGIVFGQPRHLVTDDMIRDTAKMSREVAPAYTLNDVKGQPAQVSGTSLPRPQFVLFILDGCPCSIDAQPIFNEFAKHWAGRIDFIGVINDDTKKGREWVSDYRPIFPVVPDPKKEIIGAYKARQSVYCALVSREGRIVKMWPGYSVDLMKDMNEIMAAEIGEKPRFFDTKYVPKLRITGCYF